MDNGENTQGEKKGKGRDAYRQLDEDKPRETGEQRAGRRDRGLAHREVHLGEHRETPHAHKEG